MKVEDPAPTDLPTTIFLVVSVIITVLVALFLAFSDELQTRLPTLVQPTIVVQSGRTATPTLPSPSATPSPSNTPDETAGTPTATTVSIIADAVCENVPAGWQPVVVGPADTLYSLSIRYGATVGEIVQANCLETGTVLSGMTVYLPPSPPTRVPCGPPQWWRTYVVRPGDTLYGLAIRHGTTVYAIMQANCLVESKIFAGRSLFLPPIPATVPPPTVVVPSVTPTSTPTATSTGLPSPTASATAGGTASPTTTAAPTSTPTTTTTPPATPSSTATVNPTATTTPTSGPSATAVPSATPTVPPTDTPQPTAAPTNTPLPTATNPPPTDTPQPTQSP